MKHLPLPNSILFIMFAFLLSAFAPTPRAHAELLGSWTHTQSIFIAGPPIQSVNVTYWFGPTGPFPLDYNLFENVIPESTQVGQSWTVSIADDPDYTSIVNLLTNDALDAVALTMTTDAGSFNGISFSESFFNLTPPAIDFAGSTIDAFTLTFDDFALTQQGPFNVSTFTFTFGVHGTIPAPGAAVAFVFLMAWKRRRRS